MNLSPDTIEREVEGVFWRNEVEEEIFQITFLEKPSPDLQTKLLNKQYYETYTYNKEDETRIIKGLSRRLVQQRKQTHVLELQDRQRSDETFGLFFAVPDENEICSVYNCSLLLREIVLLSNSSNFSVRIFKLLVLARLLMPGFLRVLDDEPIAGDNAINYFVYFAMVGLQLFISYVNLLFVLIGIIDYKRKLFFMKIMTSLISPAKDKDFVYSSFLPTMNILCY